MKTKIATSFEERLSRLEKQNRWLKGMLGASLVLVAGTVLLGAADTREVEVGKIRAQSFELIDPLGNVIGKFGSIDDLVILRLDYGKKSIVTAHGLSVSDSNGQNICMIGSHEGASFLTVNSPDRKSEHKIRCSSNETEVVSQFSGSKAGSLITDEATSVFAISKHGGAATLKANKGIRELSLLDGRGKTRIYCGVSDVHGANYILYDGQDKVSWDAVNGR